MSDKVILERNNDYFIIPYKIYENAILTAKKALFDYYIEKGQKPC